MMSPNCYQLVLLESSDWLLTEELLQWTTKMQAKFDNLEFHRDIILSVHMELVQGAAGPGVVRWQCIPRFSLKYWWRGKRGKHHAYTY